MSQRLEDLEPATQAMCRAFLHECEERMLPPLRVTHTLRTMDEQLHLYAKGRIRTATGWEVVDRKQVVTNAMPGQSPHNYGAAFDVAFRSHDPYPRDERLWEAVGLVGEMVGLAWGGRWHGPVDRPHFERSDWRNLRRGGQA